MIVLYQNDISIPEWYICKDDWKTDFQEVLFSWWLSMHQITSFPNFPCNMNLAQETNQVPVICVWKLSAIFWLFPPTYSTCFKQTMGLLSNNCRSNSFQMVLRKAADILAWFLQTICGSTAWLFCSDQVKHLQLIWGQGAKDVNSCCTYCNSAEHSANHQLMVDMRRTPDNLAEP